MQFTLLVALLAFALTVEAADHRSFGEHDPLNTKAAFCEMAQNHTGTKTEMFYRTAGLFDILNLCRTKPKQVEKYDFNKHILDLVLAEKIEHKENYVQALSTEQKQAWKSLEQTFAEARKAYRGTPSYKINQHVTIANIQDNRIQARCSTALDSAYISINPKNPLFIEYFDAAKNNFLLKSSAKKGAEMVAQVGAGPKHSFFKKIALMGTLSLVNAGARYFKNDVQKYEAEIQDILFHELSHPYVGEIGTHLRKHSLPGEKVTSIPVEEAYANTLAVLNSPKPLRTARNLDNGYYSEHLAALAEALKKEGVKE